MFAQHSENLKSSKYIVKLEKECIRHTVIKITERHFFALQMQTLKKHLSVKTETDCGVQQHESLLRKHSYYAIFVLHIMFFPKIF